MSVLKANVHWLRRRGTKSTPVHSQESPLRVDLPPELWLRVARWLDDETIQKLFMLNRAFYSLALDIQYHQLNLDTTGDRFQAIGELCKLFRKLGKSHETISSRVRSIWVSDDIYHGFELHRKHIFQNGPYKVVEIPSRHGIWRRIRGFIRERKMILALSPNPFARCVDVEKLELVFNGPWFSKLDSGFRWSGYAYDKAFEEGLELLCTAFKDSLHELRITMVNAQLVSTVLNTSSITQFASLEVLDMDLSGKLGSFYYSTDDFRSFISHFRDTLRALRLKYEALGEDPLKLFLGDHQHPFPHLNTLELHDAVIPIGPSMKGYTHLTSFLALCPRLKRLVLHETGRLTPIWSPLNPLYFELPQDLPLEELGCDDLSWASHSETLNKVFTEKVIRKLDYYCHSSGLFHELYGANNGFHRHLTELNVGFIRFYIDDFVPYVEELRALQVLTITCKYFSIREAQTNTTGQDNADKITSVTEFHEALPFAETSALTQSPNASRHSRRSFSSSSSSCSSSCSSDRSGPTFIRTSHLHSVDVVRHPRPFSYDCEDTGCMHCPEIRLWDVLHVFARTFPSISIFGGKIRREEVFEYQQASLFCAECGEAEDWKSDRRSFSTRTEH